MTVPPRRPNPVAPPEPASEQGISRRTALQRLAGSLGIALTAPATGAAGQHPVAAHLAQRTQEPLGVPRPQPPAFLDPHQFTTLTAVAELIVPGSAASESPRFIDDVLAIERPEIQQRFVGALAALDAAAREQRQQSFRQLTRERQIALLETALTQSSPNVALRDHVNHLKTWIAGAHYSSEAGMKELGWTGEMVFTSFPACTHAGGHE